MEQKTKKCYNMNVDPIKTIRTTEDKDFLRKMLNVYIPLDEKNMEKQVKFYCECSRKNGSKVDEASEMEKRKRGLDKLKRECRKRLDYLEKI